MRTTPSRSCRDAMSPRGTHVTKAEPALSAPGRKLSRIICSQHGASFFDELVARHASATHPGRGGACGTRRHGLVNSRQLRGPARAARSLRGAQAIRRRARRRRTVQLRNGRCRPLGSGAACAADSIRRKRAPEAVEHVARTLLRRYGVVFWRLVGAGSRLAAAVARSLARIARLESRGEIRGGRFVAGSRASNSLSLTQSPLARDPAQGHIQASGCPFPEPIRSIL